MFSKDMVEAILQGRKTQTRRAIKRQIDCVGEFQQGYGVFTPKDHISIRGYDSHGQFGEWFLKCPYGKKGDIIYGKETFFAYGHWTKITDTETGKSEWKFNDLTRDKGLMYRYYDNPPEDIYKRSQKRLGWHKRPSLFMPKGASRIWLQITDIRVERLMDISEGDAIAEGVIELGGGVYVDYIDRAKTNLSAKRSYLTLWDSINGKDSHKINPWVWVVEFENIGFEKAAMLLTHQEKA